jgi:hypothetical protein
MGKARVSPAKPHTASAREGRNNCTSFAGECLGRGALGERSGTYLSCPETGTSGWPAVAVLVGPAAAADEPTAATSGNCCLKFANRSSPGFCELVLYNAQD